MLLALALLSQSLRLVLPVSLAVSMFLIGTLVTACLVLAAWRYGLGSAFIIAWITPVVAFMQGMLPLVPFIPAVGIGSSLFVLCVWALRHSSRPVLLVLPPLIKMLSLYGCFWLLFQLLHITAVNVPGKIETAILFSMSWPQLVTGFLGVLTALAVDARIGTR